MSFSIDCLRVSVMRTQHTVNVAIDSGPKIVFFDTKCAVGLGIGEYEIGIFLVCSRNLALKSIAIIGGFTIIQSLCLLYHCSCLPDKRITPLNRVIYSVDYLVWKNVCQSRLLT